MDRFDFSGKRALIRADLNVPMDKETAQVTDNTRIKAVIPTIKKVLGDGGSVVLMSHLGRPKNGPEKGYSLRPIASEIEALLNSKVKFVGDCIGNEAFEISKRLAPGQVVLLENLRFYPHEKSGDKNFAQKLAQHGDVYINDAFGTAHRAHASTSVIAQFFDNQSKMPGYLMDKETKSVDKFMNSDLSPMVAIVGGAKVSSKLTILENLLDVVDILLIGGGMAYTFIQAKGGQTGNSMVESAYLNTAREVLAKAEQQKVTVVLPIDSIVAQRLEEGVSTQNVRSNAIPKDMMGLDIGPKARVQFIEQIKKGKAILWNGPPGVFEIEAFAYGTKALADAVVEATENGAFTLIGGGDSVAAINRYGLADRVSHVSSGGGAMLEYLEGVELPGIKALST